MSDSLPPGPEGRRLIEVAFPLREASLDSVHEKNVRHGHISTLHIWPARRPLAACRAALIATLLPDPGNDDEREELLRRLAGRVVKRTKKQGNKVVEVEETEGGILHWGHESGPDLEFFRQRIREAYGGRAPRVLDPFAGGGAIPLEAMRLGCEATAIDINPVAWFILKCTLEYPQRLAGQTWPLPEFVWQNEAFVTEYVKHRFARTNKRGERVKPSGKQLAALVAGFRQEALVAEARPAETLDWHVRAWGLWVLERARADLERFYPVVDGKPTVAYLWARTVTCKHCRATIPLLKTQWLCKKDNKRVLLTMEPNAEKSGVVFGVQDNVPVVGGNTAQRRAHDKQIGAGTMSRSGARCPCCGPPGTVAMEMEDIRREGCAGRLGAMMTAVVVDGPEGKEYRLPVPDETAAADAAEAELEGVFADVPFGVPEEPTPAGGGSGAGRAFSVQGYGLMRWRDLFTPRQLLAIGTFLKCIRAAAEAMSGAGYAGDWVQGGTGGLCCALSKLLDYENAGASWYTQNEQITHLFNRFALPIKWDFAEASPVGGASGSWDSMLVSVLKSVTTAVNLPQPMARPAVLRMSATGPSRAEADAVVTDPPYYDAIPYADTMDFFYVWLRRALWGLSPEVETAFREPLSPKWDHAANDGELIDDASRFEGDAARSKAAYEDGMYRAFCASRAALGLAGRFVVVFAHKRPNAWEALVSAIVRAGFVVDASWPIQTEMPNRTRGLSAAALASSVWLVCRKRPEDAPAGWDNRVLEEMESNIQERLRQFWDARIRGPDFVWAATGPALEAYSKHPVVKKANAPGETMSVGEFLGHVRRIVVDFVVGRVLSETGGDADASGLDDLTIYYLLHRNDFGFGEAPAGAVILYATSTGLSDSALCDVHEVLARCGGQAAAAEEEEDETEDGGEEAEPEPEGSGSQFRLRKWSERKRPNLGLSPDGRPAPVIDQIHRLLRLWKTGDVHRVDAYLDEMAAPRNPVFHSVLQALIELSTNEERSLLESLSNHLAGQAPTVARQRTLPGT